MNVEGYIVLAVPLVVIALIVSLVALVIRGRSPEERVRLLARITHWGAWGVAVLWTLGAGREIYRALFSASVPVAIEASPFWPQLPPQVAATPGTARIDTTGVNDGFSHATIHLSGLSTMTRGLLALDMFAQLVAVVVLCLLIARLAGGVLRGRVFDAVRGRELVLAGGIFGLSGLTALFANGFANSAVLAEARPRQISFSDSSWTANATDAHTQIFGIVSWTWSLSAPTWTFIAAAVAFITAMVMRRGTQLENDNEGLI